MLSCVSLKADSVSTFLPKSTAFHSAPPCGRHNHSPNPNTLPPFKMNGRTSIFCCTAGSDVNAALQMCWPVYIPKDRTKWPRDQLTDLETDLQTCSLKNWPTDWPSWPTNQETDGLTYRPICLLNQQIILYLPVVTKNQRHLIYSWVWLAAHPAVLKFETTLDHVGMPHLTCFWGIWTGIRSVYFLHVHHHICREIDIQTLKPLSGSDSFNTRITCGQSLLGVGGDRPGIPTWWTGYQISSLCRPLLEFQLNLNIQTIFRDPPLFRQCSAVCEDQPHKFCSERETTTDFLYIFYWIL